MWDKDFWNVTWSRPYGRYNSHHQKVWEVISPLVRGKVVDLGCGTCLIYKGKDVNLTGVDFSREGLNQAKINYPKGKYILADALNTGLSSKEYNTCMILGLLDYFENWEDILKEARRLVISGGFIIATLLNGFEGHNWTKYEHLVSNWYLYKEKII
jgi:SAM-dependent methyltransferase